MNVTRPGTLIPLRPNLGVYRVVSGAKVIVNPGPRTTILGVSSEDHDVGGCTGLFWRRTVLQSYVPDPLELEDMYLVYIPELSYLEVFVPLRMMASYTSTYHQFFYLHVGESSAAAAARQPGPTMAHRVDCSSVDTMETRIRDTERRMMTALEMVNMRVSYQVDVRSRESLEFYSRHHDAQKDRAAVRAEIELTGWCIRGIEVTVLETEVHRHEWQRQAADDLVVQHIMRTQALEAGARVDTLEDTGSSS
ncbi:hypothetical protein Tco_0302652 [Tanacetum coccineum]